MGNLVYAARAQGGLDLPSLLRRIGGGGRGFPGMGRSRILYYIGNRNHIGGKRPNGIPPVGRTYWALVFRKSTS